MDKIRTPFISVDSVSMEPVVDATFHQLPAVHLDITGSEGQSVFLVIGAGQAMDIADELKAKAQSALHAVVDSRRRGRP